MIYRRPVHSARLSHINQFCHQDLAPTSPIMHPVQEVTSLCCLQPAGSPRVYCAVCCCGANMAAPLEVIVSSDSGSQLWNSTVFDLHSGSSLLSYRGGNSSARGLTVLGGQYLLSAQQGKNFINVWEIQRKVRAGTSKHN